MKVEVRHHLTASGRNLFSAWLWGLRDATAKAKIATRLARLSAGNFGDCKPLSDGVWELRIDHGPGYRVYYAMIDRSCVLLLRGGDKRQQASEIRGAVKCLNDYRRRREKE